MQILIEVLALAAFQRIRSGEEPLAAAVNAYVMQDEARHVACRLACATSTRSSGEAERNEREEFVVAGLLAHARPLHQREVWDGSVCRSRNACGSSTGPTHEGFRSPGSSAACPDRQRHRPVGTAGAEAFAAMGAIEFAQSTARLCLRTTPGWPRIHTRMRS